MPEEKNKEEVVEEKVEEKSEEVKKVIKKPKKDRDGVASIYTSFNNTILQISDISGKTISKISGGMMTKHNRLKANPTVAMFVAKRAAEEAKEQGITSLYVKIKSCAFILNI